MPTSRRNRDLRSGPTWFSVTILVPIRLHSCNRACPIDGGVPVGAERTRIIYRCHCHLLTRGNHSHRRNLTRYTSSPCGACLDSQITHSSEVCRGVDLSTNSVRRIRVSASNVHRDQGVFRENISSFSCMAPKATGEYIFVFPWSLTRRQHGLGRLIDDGLCGVGLQEVIHR